jgi:hypothetical protein
LKKIEKVNINNILVDKIKVEYEDLLQRNQTLNRTLPKRCDFLSRNRNTGA